MEAPALWKQVDWAAGSLTFEWCERSLEMVLGLIGGYSLEPCLPEAATGKACCCGADGSTTRGTIRECCGG